MPTNNGLPPTKAGPEIVAHARNVDIARAVENSVSVVRADVTGRALNLVSYGSSEIIDPDGMTLVSAEFLQSDLIIADIKIAPRKQRRGWDASRNPSVMAEYFRLAAGLGE